MADKKIGVITFWTDQENYGCVLQCYALQQVLKQLGYIPFLIKFNDKLRRTFADKLLYWIRILVSLKLIREKTVRVFNRLFKPKKDNQTKGRDLNSFREKYIAGTNKIYTFSDLEINPPQADFYICGSDQIWSESLIGYNKICFLEWVDEKIPRIAYAPSFGAPCVSPLFMSKIKQSLPKFQVVTVRETSGVEICKQAGIPNAQCVPDPTLLLTQHDYSLLFSNVERKNRKYLVLYWLGAFMKEDIINEIKQFAKQNNLIIIYIPIGGEQDEIIDENCQKQYPSIQEWLFLIANAQYVLTNSFHGTVFSIIFNKQFGVYLAEGELSKKNDRILSFLNTLNLNKRIITTDLQELDKSIPYDPVNAYLQKQREEIRGKFKHWFNV
jgi:hypothetical protein